ncbi:DUF4624 family lipoprotein [Raoultibacter timonensis]|uniref:DUF4624 family lipoprotein n=1 Tax=Raoultibacter timonensis TaxID=1907662 RepID=UPI0026DB3BBE|nr:DUF4624 family lipoprotein [Raoultibacter timonensis]
MRKMAVLCSVLMSIACLTACSDAGPHAPDANGGNEKAITLELDRDYDEVDPFVNEKLFCVSEDLDALTAEGTLEANGGSVVLEIKNNRTNEVLWSNAWRGDVESGTFSVTLEDLRAADEYVVCLIGREMHHATLGIAFDGAFVRERAMPLR